MPPRQDSPLDRLAERRMLRFWARAADGAGAADLSALKALRGRARRLRREVERLIHTADGRLAVPVPGSNAMNRRLGTDWEWRHDLWRWPLVPRGHAEAGPRTDLAEGATLFHDCPLREVAVRQHRNTRSGDLSPFGLTVEVLGFEGSFLSLALDLPGEAVAGLKRRHVVSADFSIEAERPLDVYARLNIKHGPNTEQCLGKVPFGAGEMAVDFDLATTSLNEKRVEKMWLDIIFENPAMNAIRLQDLTMSRRPRAEL